MHTLKDISGDVAAAATMLCYAHWSSEHFDEILPMEGVCSGLNTRGMGVGDGRRSGGGGAQDGYRKNSTHPYSHRKELFLLKILMYGTLKSDQKWRSWSNLKILVWLAL